MAKTMLADIIIPTVFEKYAIERTAQLSALVQAGVVEHERLHELPAISRRVHLLSLAAALLERRLALLRRQVTADARRGQPDLHEQPHPEGRAALDGSRATRVP